eukprot:268778-Chlamydomonas_euryale.AAC.2
MGWAGHFEPCAMGARSLPGFTMLRSLERDSRAAARRCVVAAVSLWMPLQRIQTLSGPLSVPCRRPRGRTLCAWPPHLHAPP